MKTSLPAIAVIVLIFTATQSGRSDEGALQQTATEEDATVQEINKIQVLNFGTFHMGSTTDSFGVEFDPVAQKQAVHDIAKQLATFKPTVIVVERPPEKDSEVQAEYRKYLGNPEIKFDYVSEVQLLAYEIGRLSNTTRICGIDHKMRYNYSIGGKLKNTIDQETCMKFAQSVPGILARQEGLSTLEKLRLFNTEEALNFSLFANADILSYIGTDGNFEGADEAARFYNRNLRMYSNLNRIPLSKEDRVFILLGATHTAFLRDFLSRSPKYTLVEVSPFLEK